MGVPFYRADLPDREVFNRSMDDVWASQTFTNFGPLSEKLAAKLATLLKVEEVQLVANGTQALGLALQTLAKPGPVVTTPFTFAATPNAIRAAGGTPRFVDVDATTWNIDPRLAKEAMEGCTAVLAVHAFGNPCDTFQLDAIGRAASVPVVYDAAHAFGVELDGTSLLTHGAASACSLHATKPFHTAEGGLVRAAPDVLCRIRELENHGLHDGRHASDGTNGKLSELHAAVGLANLARHGARIGRRRELIARYSEEVTALGLQLQRWHSSASSPHSYMPILFSRPSDRDRAHEALSARGIGSRKYFWPLAKGASGTATPVAHDLSQRILCLPLYASLTDLEMDDVVRALRTAVGRTGTA